MRNKYCPECGTELDDAITHIGIIIDESGSMADRQADTISGFNEYIQSLRNDKVNGRVTLTKFNSSNSNVVYSSVPLSEVPALNNDTYIPRDMTPLYDAIGKTIRSMESVFGKVIIVIMTDGLENASRKFSRSDIFNMISRKQEQGWIFIYLGANQDAWEAGGAIGIASYYISNYDTCNTRAAYHTMAYATSCFSNSGKIDQSVSDLINNA